MSVFSELKLIFGETDKISKISKFFKNNPNILALPVDKSKNICIVTKEFYHEKLLKELSNSDIYEKIEKDNLQTELNKYNKILTSIKPYINDKKYYQLKPHNKLKEAYGLI